MSADPDAPLRGDLDVAVAVDTRQLEWTSSPHAGVSRKRLHRVGPAESGQVTSVVRYSAGSRFSAHDHPEGEEIFVLKGVFSDEHGDWPAGTYLLNPEGFRHAPFSLAGCEIFVKLRQAAEPERTHVAIQTSELEWDATEEPGVESKSLYVDDRLVEITKLERWAPHSRLEARHYENGVEIFVFAGEFSDELGDHSEGTWVRLPVGASHRPSTQDGCQVYVKYGGVAKLPGTG